MAPALPETLSHILAEAYPGRPVQSASDMATLPHSTVYQVRFTDGETVYVKHSGVADFPASLLREIAINRDVLSALPHKVAPRSLALCADPDRPWLILEDVSTTHAALPPGDPAADAVLKFVGVLARNHAQSRHIDLPHAFRNVATRSRITESADLFGLMLERFLNSHDADALPAGAHILVNNLADHLPLLVAWLSADSTLVHGDAHFWNALYGEDALLLDWELATTGPAAVDLCHALAMNLPGPLARSLEPRCLSHYARVAAEHGAEHSEDGLWHHYRVGTLYTVMEAVGLKDIPGIEDTIWRGLLANAVQSAIDHDALSLLK